MKGRSGHGSRVALSCRSHRSLSQRLRVLAWLLSLCFVSALSFGGGDPAAWDGVYVYRESDPLKTIASRCQTTLEAWLEKNCLDRDSLQRGQVMTLPCPASVLEQVPDLAKIFSAEEQMRREIIRGIRGYRRVALTFDAGGDFGCADLLLETLVREHIPATFFVTGSFAEKHHEWIQSVARAGYPIYNHSWSHPHFTELAPERIVEELRRTDELIVRLTGRSTRPYWRPPFGDRNERVLRAAARAGFRSVYWTIDSLDSYGEPKSADFLVARILEPRARAPRSESGCDHLDGAIVLMHADVKATLEALPRIAAGLRARGFQLVTLADLVRP